MSEAEESLATVKRFIAAYNKNVRKAYENFTTSEFEWMEAPTQLFPAGRGGGQKDVFEAIAHSESMVRGETLEILSAVASGDAVAMECIWRSTFVVDIKEFAAGDKLTLRGGMFYRVKNGKIMSAHEYVSSPVDL